MSTSVKLSKLIENYDQAFLTRLVCIEMKRPDRNARRQIWRNHLYPVEDGIASLHIPLDKDIDLEKLTAYDFCGRDIRNAVKRACILTVLQNQQKVTQAALEEACRRTQSELDALARAKEIKPRSVSIEECRTLGQKFEEQLTEGRRM